MYWFPFIKKDVTGHYIFSPFSETRIFGVLQRIALCYGIAAALFLYLKPKNVFWVSLFLLAIYWIILLSFGGKDPFGMQTNAGFFIDRWLIGDKHMYHGEGVPFDPEGLLSTLPAIVNVTSGYLVAFHLNKKGKSFESLFLLMISGIILLFSAYCWNFWFPINKKLWTSSYVFFSVGLDCIIIATIIYLIEIRKTNTELKFFKIFGRNPLVIYLLSELSATLLSFFKTSDGSSFYDYIYIHFFSFAGEKTGSFLFAIWYMLMCWCVAYLMDRRKIYIKL